MDRRTFYSAFKGGQDADAMWAALKVADAELGDLTVLAELSALVAAGHDVPEVASALDGTILDESGNLKAAFRPARLSQRVGTLFPSL